MRRVASRGRRVALLVTLVGAAAVLAGCAQAPPAEPVRLSVLDADLHARLPVDVREVGELVVGTDPSYAPASSYAPDGRTIVGFEPDLAAELGTVLGVRLRLVDTAFPDLLGQVDSEQLDLAISAVTTTPQRAEQVDFVTYFTAGTSIVVQRGNPAGIGDLDDLCGNTVAVGEGTVQVDLLGRSQRACDRPIQVRAVESSSTALLQLRTGRVVAVLADYPPAVHLTTSEDTGPDYQLASTAQYEPGLYGIAVARHRAELRDAVRAALELVIRSGAYADVLHRWEVSHGAVARPTVTSR